MSNNFVVDAITCMIFNVIKSMVLTFMLTGFAAAFYAAFLPVIFYSQLPDHLLLNVMHYWLASIAFAGLIRVTLRPLSRHDLGELWLGWTNDCGTRWPAKYPGGGRDCSCMKLAKGTCYATRGCWHLVSKSVWIEATRDVIAVVLMFAICAIVL